MLTFLTGGARSGKSSLAVRLASDAGRPVVFVATGRPEGDDEWRDRVAQHRAERPGHWTTVEEQVDLVGALSGADGEVAVIVDCLTLWLTNVLEAGWTDEDAIAVTAKAVEVARTRSGPTIVVSNEVGSATVPMEAGLRRFRDLLGRINATWAGGADRAVLVVAGLVLPLGQLDD